MQDGPSEVQGVICSLVLCRAWGYVVTDVTEVALRNSLFAKTDVRMAIKPGHVRREPQGHLHPPVRRALALQCLENWASSVN